MKNILIISLLTLFVASFSSCNNSERRNSNDAMTETKKNTESMETKSTGAKRDVLILSSSPRKGGNSDLLCDRFMEGAKEAGHNVEKIRLQELEFNFLSLDTPNKEDDATVVVQKMIAADVIVLATPVYYYAMSGQMKTMIDRTYVQHREISDKDFYFIIAGADAEKENFQPVVLEFRGFLQALENPTEKGIIYGTGVWEKGSVGETSAMSEAYEMGKSI